MQAQIMAISPKTSKDGSKQWLVVTLEDGHEYGYWDDAKCHVEEGDEIKCEVSQSKDGKYFNLRNVEIVHHADGNASIVKAVDAEMISQGKATVVHPKDVPKTNGVDRKPLHALSLNELENEYQNALREHADGWYIGQISNIIKYEQIRLAISEMRK